VPEMEPFPKRKGRGSNLDPVSTLEVKLEVRERCFVITQAPVDNGYQAPGPTSHKVGGFYFLSFNTVSSYDVFSISQFLFLRYHFHMRPASSRSTSVTWNVFPVGEDSTEALTVFNLRRF